MEKGKTDELFEPFNWTSNTEQTEKKAVELTREQTKARTNERKLVWTNESSYERTKARTNERKLVRTKKARTNERTNTTTNGRTNKQAGKGTNFGMKKRTNKQ